MAVEMDVPHIWYLCSDKNGDDIFKEDEERAREDVSFSVVDFDSRGKVPELDGQRIFAIEFSSDEFSSDAQREKSCEMVAYFREEEAKELIGQMLLELEGFD